MGGVIRIVSDWKNFGIFMYWGVFRGSFRNRGWHGGIGNEVADTGIHVYSIGRGVSRVIGGD